MGERFSKAVSSNKATTSSIKVPVPVSSNNEAVDVSSNNEAVSSNKATVSSKNSNIIRMNAAFTKAERTDEEEKERQERLKVQRIETSERKQQEKKNIEANYQIQQEREKELSDDREIFKNEAGFGLIPAQKAKADLERSKLPKNEAGFGLILAQKAKADLERSKLPKNGGNNKNKPSIIGRKEILGKERCIYKKVGDRKEYVKHKGDLITVKDYKRIIKAKNNKRK